MRLLCTGLILGVLLWWLPAKSWAKPAGAQPLLSEEIPAEVRFRVLGPALQAFFNAGFRPTNHGAFFFPALVALKGEFGFEIDLRSRMAQISVTEAPHYGLRFTDAAGLAAIPPKIRQAFLRLPRERLTPFAGAYADYVAAYCIAAQRSQNERIAKQFLAAEAREPLHFRLLHWLGRLREGNCIGAKTYEVLAEVAAHRTRRTLTQLEPGDHILALFVLKRSGFLPALQWSDVQAVLTQSPVEQDWEGFRSKIFGRQDVALAAAYLLAHAAVQGQPGLPAVNLSRMVQAMQANGLIEEGSPFDTATQGWRQWVSYGKSFDDRLGDARSSLNRAIANSERWREP